MSVQSLFPILTTADLPALTEFYLRAFAAEVDYRFPGEDGDAYVSLAIGGASLGIAHDPPLAAQATGDRVALWFYVDDVDVTFASARDAGATVQSAPTDMPWGERVAQVRDPDANLIHLATPPLGQGSD